MSYWLLKSEPGTWSWQNQLDKGEKGEGWDGVRNYQASNNMKSMHLDDLCFFYHSVKEKKIVGIVKVIKLYHPDPTDLSGRFGMVNVKAIKSLNEPVTLSQIKNEEKLNGITLIKQSRLSVMPISDTHWNIILSMSKTKI